MAREERSSDPPMTPERWRAVDALLREALLREPDRRASYVQDACGGDDALRREVVSLLAAHDRMTASFLEQPPAEAMETAQPASARNAQVPVPLVAALVGRYELEREIARGGMATVYLARDLRHERSVAIKVMRAEVAAAVGGERFLEEIRVTARLQHPHILPLFDSGSAGSLLWYVMPFVEGETLRSRLAREGRLPVDEGVRIAREVADALDHAHAHGIVHRDIKPENILLHQGHALVADFGVALALERAGGERLTRTGLALGTPQYMAPEQATGERVIDGRVDVYALGVVVYEMLAGEPPFAAVSPQAVVQRMLHVTPTPLIAHRPGVPSAIDAAVRRALAKRPDERFANASVFAAALAAPVAEPPAAPVAAERESPNVALNRRVGARVAVFAAIGGIGAGLAGGWGLAHSSIGQTPPNPPTTAKWQAPTVKADAGDINAVISPGASNNGLSLVIVDRAGQVQRRIAANRPWTPRLSPDGRRVAYGAYGPGRGSSDVWVMDLDQGTTKRLTDDDGDSNDPQWSPDGATIAYSVNAPGGKDIAAQRLADGATRIVATRIGTQFPSDWLRDGSALLVSDDGAGEGYDVIVQPMDGSAARSYAATAANELAARISPDGRWIAYISDASGRGEVYLDSYPRPSRRVLVSEGGGIDPVWRGDGRELYYWHVDSLIAAQVDAGRGQWAPAISARRVLFQMPYQSGLNTMYDASADGSRFVIVKR